MRCLYEFRLDLVVNEKSLPVAKLGRSLRVTVMEKDRPGYSIQGAGEHCPSAS